MRFLLYPFAALLSLVIDFLCKFFLNWIVVLFADAAGNLPRCLCWFQTFDATLDEGMLARRRELLQAVPGQEWASFTAYPATALERYLNRALWLFRNSGYGFDYTLLGVTWQPQQWRVLRFVSTDSLELFMAVGRGFNIYYHGRFGMLKMGWKAWNLFDHPTQTFKGSWGNGGKIPVTFSINPFKTRGN